ncbi:MAG TPA: helix-turn-helix domain-containing protein [Candidatus Thermoplasmatota archaeon]|nr:helix-turn-helix domain-containing protein [Candidatus Thermoplasmatota archaeon]
MRSTVQAIGALALALAVPLAAAAPDLPELPDLPGVTREVGHIAQDVAEAAGLEGATPALPPVAAPVTGDEFGLPWFAVAGAALGVAGLAAVFFFGGARFVTPAEVLQNDVRQRIFRYLKEKVGANLKQVTDDLGLTTTNAIWHLRKLEEAGLIHSKRFNGYKVFYPAEGGVEARKLSLGKTALANGNAQEVFEHVVAHPGTHQREIARALGVNHGTVRWHLKKLLHAELIVETRRGKASAYEPTPMGLHALREVVARKPVVAEPAPVGTAA